MNILSALPLLVLAGCGASRFSEDSPAVAPFPRFAAVQVRVAPTTVVVPDDIRADLTAFAESLPKQLEDDLRRRNLLVSGADGTLVVDLRFVTYDPGSRAARWIIGLGVGAGSVEARVALRNGAAPLGSGVAKGTVVGGWFGGSMSTAQQKLVKAIVKYIEKHSSAGRMTGGNSR